MKKNILVPIEYTETVTILNENGEEVTEEVTRVRYEAQNVEMTAEEIAEIEAQQNTPQAIQSRIESLKAELATLDYIGVKIATGRATRDEYATQIARMNEIASEINRLEAEVSG